MDDEGSDTTIPRFSYYLALMADTTKLSDRRQTTNDLFVGLNVVFFTGMGALFYTTHLKSWWVTGLYVAITVLALFLNLTWVRLNDRYRRLIELRIHYMQKLESELRNEDIFADFPPYPVKPARTDKDRAMSAVGSVETSLDSPAPVTQRTGIFTVEAEHLYYSGSHFGFSGLERRLMVIFTVAYLFATVSVGVATYLIMTHTLSSVSL